MNISITITDQNERTTMNFDSFDRAILGLVHEQDWHDYYGKSEILNSQDKTLPIGGRTSQKGILARPHESNSSSSDTHSPELKNQETNQRKSPNIEKLDEMPDYETVDGVAPESPKVAVSTKKGTTKDICSFHSADNIKKRGKK